MKMTQKMMLMMGFLVGCGSSYPPSETVKVYQSRNVLQCEPESGIQPPESAATLSNAGVEVFETYCGYKTGVMYPAACGMGTPDILIHRIAEADLSMAQQAGFSRVDALILPEQGISYEMADCDAP